MQTSMSLQEGPRTFGAGSLIRSYSYNCGELAEALQAITANLRPGTEVKNLGRRPDCAAANLARIVPESSPPRPVAHPLKS